MSKVKQLLRDKRGFLATPTIGAIMVGVVMLGTIIAAVNGVFPTFFGDALGTVSEKSGVLLGTPGGSSTSGTKSIFFGTDNAETLKKSELSKIKASGKDLVFFPQKEGFIVTDVTAISGGQPLEVRENADGSYTIPNEKLTQDIKLNANVFAGSFDFISAEEYGVLDANQKVVILETAPLSMGRYELADESTFFNFFFQSGYYGSNKAGTTTYVAITDATKTVAQLSQGLFVDTTATHQLLYGDINGDKKVSPADAGLINSMIGRTMEFSVIQRLRADVTGNRTVNQSDNKNALNIYVGLPIEE